MELLVWSSQRRLLDVPNRYLGLYQLSYLDKLLVFATGSLVDGTFGVVFSASVAGRTKSLPCIVSLLFALPVSVAVPSSPTVTVVPSGNVDLPFSSLLASSTFFRTLAFSPSVKLLLYATRLYVNGTSDVVFL